MIARLVPTALTLSVLSLLSVFAGSDARAEPPSRCTLITGATVWGHSPTGPTKLDGHGVRLRGPLIDEVSPAANAPDRSPGCTIVDGRGLVLTAGFIDPFTSLGLIEIDGENTTVDTDNKALHQDEQQLVRAAVRTSLAFNPRSALIPVARAAGVTSALSWPVGGVISGQGFWVDLVGHPHARRRDSIRKDPAGLFVQLGARAESRVSALHVFDLALREAAIWQREQRAIERVQRAPLSTPALDLTALDRVLAESVPLVFRVERAADIEGLLETLDALSVKKNPVVLIGASEAWLVADELAARGVSVVLDPLLYGPGGFDQLAARRDHAAVLQKAGVKVMVSPMDTHLMKKLRQLVGNAIREGLPWVEGLRAVTETPAEVFGMKGYGRIAVGARANLVLWSGDPFELSSHAVKVFIDGVDLDLRTRQTELFERWRTLGP